MKYNELNILQLFSKALVVSPSLFFKQRITYQICQDSSPVALVIQKIEAKRVWALSVCPELYQTEVPITETEKSICGSRLSVH